MRKPIITFVSPVSISVSVACLCAARLEKELGIEMPHIPSVTELFPLLSNPTYHTDIVCIDLERLLNTKEDVDIFDIINTLATLIKCTVYRDELGGKPIRRSTKICILISDKSDPEIVKQAMLLPDVFLGTLMSGTWTYEMVKENIARNLAGDFSHPRHVVELVRPKKVLAAEKPTIVLTPRQGQILNIVTARGASNKVIAKMLNISESTVKLHIGAIMKKYGVKNRTQLAVFSKKAS